MYINVFDSLLSVNVVIDVLIFGIILIFMLFLLVNLIILKFGLLINGMFVLEIKVMFCLFCINLLIIDLVEFFLLFLL